MGSERCTSTHFTIQLKTDTPQPSNLMGSGAELVWAQAMYAIIGALALEQGSVVANRICRDRLLAPLGLAKQVVGEIDGARS